MGFNLALNKNIRNFFKISPNNLERKIHKRLQKEISAQDIFKEIENHSDTEGVSRFLFHSGLYKTLLLFSLDLLKQKKSVSWHYVMKVFIKHKIYPNKKLAEILFHGWLKNDKHIAIFSCEQWGKISPEFEQMRIVFIDHLESMSTSDQGDLLEQLDFVQAQGMISKEEEIIDKLISLNPASENYRKLKKDLGEKKALLVIQNQKSEENKRQSFKNQFFKSDFNFESMKKDWMNAIFHLAEKDNTQIKNLALFLYFCGNPGHAVNLFERYISKPSDYWFYLEWTLETQQFTKGLTVVNYLFSKSEYSQFELLPLIYIKAQFLYGLGKHSMAIQCLEAISHIYPNYKSTNYFLNQWSKHV